MSIIVTTFSEVIQLALNNERQAEASYRKMAEMAESPKAREFLSNLADEEAGHQKKLRSFALSATPQRRGTPSYDQQIHRTLGPVTISPHTTVVEIMMVAIKKEERSALLYRTLAQQAPTAEIRKAFLLLAQQEDAHRKNIERFFTLEVLENI